jgi:hypothetical protein
VKQKFSADTLQRAAKKFTPKVVNFFISGSKKRKKLNNFSFRLNLNMI